MITPGNILELSNTLRSGNDEGQRIEKISLNKLNRVIRHTPQDLTVTVESGTTLSELQRHLAKSSQWLPLDPPGGELLTIQELLDQNLSGPRRFGFGTARDWVIGLKAVLPDGRVIESGGNVVKNVAGYDLHKLLIGARGELAVVVEATFKVTPLPERESFFAACCTDLDTSRQLLSELLSGPLNPHVLDVHTVGTSNPQIVVGLWGSAKEVDWQCGQLPDSVEWHPADLLYSEALLGLVNSPGFRRSSVLPSKLTDALKNISNGPFIARAGNGVYYHTDRDSSPIELSAVAKRIKNLFDPWSRLNINNGVGR